MEWLWAVFWQVYSIKLYLVFLVILNSSFIFFNSIATKFQKKSSPSTASKASYKKVSNIEELADLKKFEECEKLLADWIAIEDENALCLYSHFYYYLEKSKTEVIIQAVGFDEETREPFDCSYPITIYNQPEFSKSIEYIKKAIELKPNIWEFRYKLIDAFLDAGNAGFKLSEGDELQQSIAEKTISECFTNVFEYANEAIDCSIANKHKWCEINREEKFNQKLYVIAKMRNCCEFLSKNFDVNKEQIKILSQKAFKVDSKNINAIYAYGGYFYKSSDYINAAKIYKRGFKNFQTEELGQKLARAYDYSGQYKKAESVRKKIKKNLDNHIKSLKKKKYF